MNIVSTDNISLILQAGESNTVEFKTRVSGLPNSLPKIISAFANAEGGVIILGYDECRRFVNGITNNELEVLRKVIRANSLEDVCYTYTVPYKEKILAVVQVEKSKSIIVAGGGAYIRNGINTIPLASKDVIARILSDSETSGTSSSELVLERLEKKVEQLYDQLRYSQEVYEDELQRQKEEHRKEVLSTKRSNWFFCLLGVILGGIVGKIF